MRPELYTTENKIKIKKERRREAMIDKTVCFICLSIEEMYGGKKIRMLAAGMLCLILEGMRHVWFDSSFKLFKS